MQKLHHKPVIAFLGGRILGKKCLDILYKYRNKIVVAFVIAHKKDGVSGSDWNPPLLPYAKELGFKTYTPSKLSDPDVIKKFQHKKIDVLLNPFCNRLIPKEILAIPKLGSINFHYGKLPTYKGRFIVSHIIFNQEIKTCATAHYIVEDVDAGDIIFEKPVKVSKQDTARDLYMKCTEAATILFEKTLNTIIEGKKLPRRRQQGRSTYYRFKELNNCEVNLSWDKKKIERFIRAVSFAPISYPLLRLKNTTYRIVKTDNSREVK